MGSCIYLRKGTIHTPPSTGILASELEVGTIVKLLENSAPVEYIVVNQGIPSESSNYDLSCIGTWLLRKDIYGTSKKWANENANDYSVSLINTYLNSDYYNLFNNNTKNLIKQVIIPYHGYGSSGDIHNGSDGLSCKIFLLSGYEVGYLHSDFSNLPIVGAKLDYFIARTSGAETESDAKRVAYLNGVANNWYLRDPRVNSNTGVWYVNSSGYGGGFTASNESGVRPALILPYTAKFDAKTLILKS